MRRHHVRARMQAVLNNLNYDFSHFTLDGFSEWLANQRNRKIVFVPRSLPPKIFGACIKADGVDVNVLEQLAPSAVIFGKGVREDNVDLIFFEADTPVVHRVHIRLHELSHLVCGHPTVEIGSHRAQALLRSADPIALSHLECLLLRSVRSDEHEREAETLTDLIQERVQRYSRLDELYTAIAAEGDFTDYFASYVRAMEQDNR
jgi:hypothetical protein